MLSSFDNSQVPQPVINKIKSAQNMGENESTQSFFSELSLPIGEVEKSIFRLRGRFAHGYICKNSEAEKLIVACRAYRTLINRVILKIIGYDGEYVDYSTQGFPFRKIDVPLGGPRGDGRAIVFDS